MSVEIVSDKLLEMAQNSGFPDNYHRNDVTIRSWMGFHNTPISPEILVIDLDLTKRTNDYGTIPLLGKNVKMRENFQRLANNVVPFLESGRVLIALVSNETSIMDLSNATSYSWLNQLQSADFIDHQKKRRVEMAFENSVIEQYLDFVEWYRYGIRVRDDVVNDPKILARNPTDKEPVAVSLGKYLDPNGVMRAMSGQLILLPQPTSLNARNLNDVVDALVNLGEEKLSSEPEGDREIETHDNQLTLPASIFDDQLSSRCAHHFEQENYEEAVQNALKTLEVKIREAGDFSKDDYGDNLATDAFNPEDGPLSFGETKGEKEGVMFLYRSAFKTFYNPTKHRFLGDLDKEQAYHILCFVNMLIKMLEDDPITVD